MLRQLYEEVQEPMMDAMQSMNQQQQPSSSSVPSTNTQQSTAPTNSAMPNPWASGQSGGTGTFPAANPYVGLGGMGGMPGMGGMGGMPGMGGMGGMNPAAINSMMSNPMFQQMYQQMMNDPNALQQVQSCIVSSDLTETYHGFV